MGINQYYEFKGVLRYAICSIVIFDNCISLTMCEQTLTMMMKGRYE